LPVFPRLYAKLFHDGMPGPRRRKRGFFSSTLSRICSKGDSSKELSFRHDGKPCGPTQNAPLRNQLRADFAIALRENFGSTRLDQTRLNLARPIGSTNS
jgi:hypothetical protein